MTERYDTTTAHHYAAYRPPLHQLILEKAFSQSDAFKSGLDVGCGTGYSAAALSKFASSVCGVDINKQMIDLAEAHTSITYRVAEIEQFNKLPNQPYDVVTFAGSLFYTKSEAMRHALKSICSEDAIITVYDFNILSDELMRHIGIPVTPEASEYNHDIGLADWEEFIPVTNHTDRITIDVTPEQAAHILLSDSFRYDHIHKSWNTEELFKDLTNKLENQSENLQFNVDIWLKKYIFKPE